MKWKKLKEFVNTLPEAQLENEVILWREDLAITKIEAEQLQEDHYIEVDNPEDGCFPESEIKDKDSEVKKVHDKGFPILYENF